MSYQIERPYNNLLVLLMNVKPNRLLERHTKHLQRHRHRHILAQLEEPLEMFKPLRSIQTSNILR